MALHNEKKSYTILMVEDDESVRDPLQMYLELHGFSVFPAADGVEALSCLEEQNVDVVVSDLNMPRMDGFQLLERVNANRPQLPFIVLSGAGTYQAVVRALRGGAWDYLEKPVIDFDLLKHALYSVLEKRDLIRMAEKYQQLFEQGKRIRSEEREEELRLRKIIEEQLLKSKQEWEETVNFLPDPLALYTRDHKIIRLNRAMADALGVAMEKAVGERLCLVESCHGDEGSECPHSRLMRTEEARVSEIHNEKTDIHYEVRALPFYELWETRVAGSVVHARDISERVAARRKEQELQARLLHSQKLESVGQLASGIAHEINTPAQYVSSNIDFLEEAFGDFRKLVKMLDELGLNSDDQGRLNELLDELDWEFLATEIPVAISQTREGLGKISKIVKAMKEFSQPGTRDKQDANINTIIDTTATVARNEWKYDAELTLDLDPDLPSFPCLVDEMGQVVLNLIVNAAQAIADAKTTGGDEGKGTITITTRNDGDAIIVTVSDTGAGVSEDIQDKIFDPFFTTKEVGKGTGQGLAIAYDVIHEKHGGTITCASRPGEGAVFTLTLPLGN